jgi:N-acetylmuramoyl-L-alanine amidase
LNKLFILDVAHGKSTPGKRSPDGKHLEYLWSREMCARILDLARYEGLDVTCPFLNHENEPGLSTRVKTYQGIPTSKTKVMLSIHNNA